MSGDRALAGFATRGKFGVDKDPKPAGWTLEDAFPEVDPGQVPLGMRVMVQLMLPPDKLGSILLPAYTKEAEQDNTQVARVIMLGPIAFKERRAPFDPWPEGAWVKEGDFVMAPKYGGSRWIVGHPSDPGKGIVLAMFNDHELISKLTSASPLDLTQHVNFRPVNSIKIGG